MQGQPDLARNGLRQRDLARRPRPGLRPVQPEHPDHPVEDDDRRREHRARAELHQRVDVPQRFVEELRGVAHVCDGNGAALARGEVRDRQPAGVVADRRQALHPPLRADRKHLGLFADPDETARRADRAARLGHGHAGDRVEVVHRAHAARDLADEPLARKRLIERIRRASAVERDRGFPGQGLHQPQLVRGERTTLARGRSDQHADNPLLDDERHERTALCLGRLREAPADERRGLDVVHRHRSRLEVGARDSRRLVVQVHANLAEPVEVRAAGAREQADRLVLALVDERESRELDPQQRSHLVEEHARDLDRVLRARERIGERRNGSELAVAQRHQLLCFTRAWTAQHHPCRVAPAPEEDQGRNERDQRRDEGRPDMPAERRAFVEHDGAEDRGRDRDPGEHEDEGDVGDADPAPLAPERGRQGCGDEQVRPRQHEQRNGVEVDSLLLGTHWAIRMIGRPGVCVETARPESRFPDAPLRIGKMGHTAYWKRMASALASRYWAMRAACPVPGLVARGEQ